MPINLIESTIREKMVDFISKCSPQELIFLSEAIYGGKFYYKGTYVNMAEGSISTLWDYFPDENYDGTFGEEENAQSDSD